MAGASSPEIAFRDIAIVGGGCYGVFYAGQLLRARRQARVAYRRLLVIDRDPGCRFARELGTGPDRELVASDWDPFFDRWLGSSPPGAAGPGDAIVPSPLMPHLMFDWLLRRARAVIVVGHDTEFVRTSCSQAILLERGEVLYQGSPETAVLMYHDLLAERPKRAQHSDQPLDL